MVLSSDETAHKKSPTLRLINTSSALRLIENQTFSGINLCETDNVRNYKRSRWDERQSYKQVGHVGSGGFGNCVLLQKKANLTLRVCKIQKRSKSVSGPLEIEILRDILHDHPRIIRLHEAIVHTNTMQLYFDYYPGGDLFKVIVHYFEEWQNIPESFIWHCFLQISEGLAFMHHGFDRRHLCGPPPASVWQSIIHGDIKPENIFLGPPTPDTRGYPSLVLGDFGLATIGERPVAGTWKWQPPELPISSMKADVWAVGAVIHALAHEGRPPLRPCPDGMNHHDFYRWPAARKPMPLLGNYSDELHGIVVHGALQSNPQARYSSLEMLQCVIDEVELGVASDMGWEPLIGPNYSAKSYDENGVTQNTTVSSVESLLNIEPMNLQEAEPKVYYDPMDYADPMTPQEVGPTVDYDPMDYADPMIPQVIDPMVHYDPMEYANPMNFQNVEPTVYHNPMEYAHPMNFQDVEPTVYHGPMEYGSCY